MSENGWMYIIMEYLEGKTIN